MEGSSSPMPESNRTIALARTHLMCTAEDGLGWAPCTHGRDSPPGDDSSGSTIREGSGMLFSPTISFATAHGILPSLLVVWKSLGVASENRSECWSTGPFVSCCVSSFVVDAPESSLSSERSSLSVSLSETVLKSARVCTPSAFKNAASHSPAQKFSASRTAALMPVASSSRSMSAILLAEMSAATHALRKITPTLSEVSADAERGNSAI
mmetsp:Transcript_35668/g.71502  ORF Transcript_35668/g.71502 Transcript_35668/m.71502 type:complete len:210 (+) Transcript_35668:233-862(+)